MQSHGSHFMMVSGDFNDRCLSWTDTHCSRPSEMGLNLFNLSTVYNLTQLIHRDQYNISGDGDRHRAGTVILKRQKAGRFAFSGIFYLYLLRLDCKKYITEL